MNINVTVEVIISKPLNNSRVEEPVTETFRLSKRECPVSVDVNSVGVLMRWC